MAIYRNGVRVKRPNSYCDEGENPGRTVTELKGKCMISLRTAEKQKRVDSKHETRFFDGDSVTDAIRSEPCQVGDTVLYLPSELLDLDDLRGIFSLDTWNYFLTEKERQSLCNYLPEMDEVTFRQTLTELFEGQIFNFCSPLMDMLKRLKSGLYHPRIVKYGEGLRLLDRKQHLHHIREYYNRMVYLCMQMQSLWSSLEDADIKDRVRLWHKCKNKLDHCSKSEIHKSMYSAGSSHLEEVPFHFLNMHSDTDVASQSGSGPFLRIPESGDCGGDDVSVGMRSENYAMSDVLGEETEGSSSSVEKQLFQGQSSVTCTLPDAPPSALMFSFSLMHLLSAVRTALLVGTENMHFGRKKGEGVHFPALSFKELVRRVRACPGDHRILDAQEPLEGLVRGALRMLSNTLNAGAEDWDPFVVYDRASKTWSWVGHVPLSSISKDVLISAEAWCASPKTLYKMQEAFASWLLSVHEILKTLGQLARLPLPYIPPPMEEGERFRDLKQQKGLVTISSSSNEMRALFQKEETIRYMFPYMVFYYTNAVGQKSAVAPLRRFCSKPNSKARDHPILKLDRPSHVTILCLVRDAAARLPQNTGTQADVCVLIRDSQFLVDDVSDAQLSQVVSGALDRLQYERDPCVRFDGDKKLWVYLHADRDEDDFDDDGTMSLKGQKRVKKEEDDGTDFMFREMQDTCGSEHDLSPVNGANNMQSSQSLKICASGTPELLYNQHCSSLGGSSLYGHGQPGEEFVLPFIDVPPSIQPICMNMQSHPMGWEVYSVMESRNRL